MCELLLAQGTALEESSEPFIRLLLKDVVAFLLSRRIQPKDTLLRLRLGLLLQLFDVWPLRHFLPRRFPQRHRLLKRLNMGVQPCLTLTWGAEKTAPFWNHCLQLGSGFKNKRLGLLMVLKQKSQRLGYGFWVKMFKMKSFLCLVIQIGGSELELGFLCESISLAEEGKVKERGRELLG